ncbi:prepilin-type N-terminal cleavage/methylation domain-containing protein [bacterium]|nr:prepilin-type N-terminal cleavage/methylation domain-containing protein [bacterium]
MDITSKKGFTLAEILITIGIIGVISAITIPQLLTNYQKRQTTTKLKKIYSELQQAVKLSEADNEDWTGWDFDLKGVDFFDKYLFPYIKGITKDSNPKTLKGIYKRPNMQNDKDMLIIIRPSITYKTLNGTNITLSNITHEEFTAINIMVDLNGDFGPNVWGKDTFIFMFNRNNGLHLQGYRENNTRENLLTDDNLYSCNKNKLGTWCGELIRLDGWEISKDYPW